MEFTSVSFIVCATDEENSLIKTVTDINRLCRDVKPEKTVIVLSETATPGCRKAAEYCVSLFPGNTECIIQKRPGLRGAALDAADIIDSSHIIGISADYSLSLDNIPIMIEKAEKEPDVIFKNSRFLSKNSFKDYPKSKFILNVCGQCFLRLLFNTKLTDLTSPLQIMPASLYKTVNWKETGFAFFVEMVLIPLRLGIKIVELPAVSLPRTEGRSKNSFRQTAHYLTAAIRIRFTPEKRLLK